MSPKLVKALPDFDVSRETSDKLKQYQELLHKWQKTINLVAPSTLEDSWNRHFEDSVQMAGLVSRESKTTVYDIGSGAGFPGLVLAAALPDADVNMIESDQRKCQFLRTVSREANIPVTVHTARVENVDIPAPDIITARALASLDQLLEWTEKWWQKNHSIELLFLKGAQAEAEISQAQNHYDFNYEIYQSKTSADGRILRLTSIRRIP